MDKCSPVEMRKNLEMVKAFKDVGIDFCPVPVRDAKHKDELMNMGRIILEEQLKSQ